MTKPMNAPILSSITEAKKVMLPGLGITSFAIIGMTYTPKAKAINKRNCIGKVRNESIGAVKNSPNTRNEANIKTAMYCSICRPVMVIIFNSPNQEYVPITLSCSQ
jgi:hypothetical protein